MKNNEIIRIYGTNYKEMTKALLMTAGLKSLIPEGARIGIKPNLMSCIPAEFGATTHPEVVSGIIEYLQENGFQNITVIEGSWVGDKTEESFEICGYNKLASEYGVSLFDTQKDGYHKETAYGRTVNVCDIVRNIDFLINVPVIKGHCQTNITNALKNLKGLIPNFEKRRFHAMGLHKPISILNSVIKQDFIVTDHICGDLDCESGGNPYYSNCIMASVDPVLTDAYACRLLGYELKDVPYIGLSEEAGVGSADLGKMRLRTVGSICPEEETLPVSHRIFKLKDMACDVDTCSACYESLMRALSRLSDEGLLDNFTHKIMIGQGNRNKTGEYGIGNCTAGFNHSIPGCPPSPEDIYSGIKGWISDIR